MSATFDPALLTPIDWMRDALGDVNIDAPYAPDATYEARLTDADGNWRLAAAAMARSFASRAINDPTSFSAPGDLSVGWTNRANEWLRIAAALEADAARLTPAKGGFWTATLERGDLAQRDEGEYSIELKRR